MVDAICNNYKHFKGKADCTDDKNPLYDVYIKNVKGDIEHYIAKGSNMKFYHGIVRVEDENGKVVICDVNRFAAYSQE